MSKKIGSVALIGVFAITALGLCSGTVRAEGKITNFDAYSCKEHEGGLWQQLPDGTWASPNDPINTCLTGGMPASWLASSTVNGWNASGANYNFPYLQQSPNYQWGTNYPGGYTNYQSWLTNCVLMESILPRPECQTFSRLYQNYPTYQTSQTSSQTTKVLRGLMLGYVLNQMFN